MVGLRVYAPETDGERQLVVEWESPTNALGSAFTYFVQWVDFSKADTDWLGVANVSDDNVTVNSTLNPYGNYTYYKYSYTITNLTACSCYNVSVRPLNEDASVINHCTRPNSIISYLL